MLTNPVTAAGAGGMLLLKKRLLDAAVDIAVEQVMNQVLPMAIEPLAQELPAVIMAALDAPSSRPLRVIRTSSTPTCRRWSRPRVTWRCTPVTSSR